MTNNRSRSVLSVLNILSGFANRFLTSLLKLVGRIVFLRYLSAELYGVSGLFSNVLGLLALAELGIGTAITFSLYKPIAEKDEEKIRSLMRLYKKAYYGIAAVVLILGLSLMPFLTKLIRDYRGIDHFYLIYLLFLANMVIDYLFSYKRTLAQAAQEGYRLVPFTTVFEALLCLVQMGIIFLLHTNPLCFLIYLFAQTFFILLQNIVINSYLNRKFPILVDKTPAKPLDAQEKKSIFVNIKALLFHKIGGVVVAGTDNLLISRLVDLVTVGIYSNYSTLISTVAGIVYLFVGNTTASFGNLIAVEKPEKRMAVFEEMQFFCYALYGICSAFFLTLFQPFISLAYGEGFLMDFPVVVLVVVANFYLLGLTYPLDVVKSAAGIYDRDKWVPLVQAAVNLAVSILLGIRMGLAGIFWGTLVSTLIPLPFKPVILYREVFSARSARFFISLGYQALTAAVMCTVCIFACRPLAALSLPLQIGLSFVVTLILSVGLFLLMNLRSPHLPSLLGRVKSILKRK